MGWKRPCFVRSTVGHVLDTVTTHSASREDPHPSPTRPCVGWQRSNDKYDHVHERIHLPYRTNEREWKRSVQTRIPPTCHPHKHRCVERGPIRTILLVKRKRIVLPRKMQTTQHAPHHRRIQGELRTTMDQAELSRPPVSRKDRRIS